MKINKEKQRAQVDTVSKWRHTGQLIPSTKIPHDPKPYARIGDDNRCATCGDIIEKV